MAASSRNAQRRRRRKVGAFLRLAWCVCSCDHRRCAMLSGRRGVLLTVSMGRSHQMTRGGTQRKRGLPRKRALPSRRGLQTRLTAIKTQKAVTTMRSKSCR